jgi:hypothetical protein
MDPILTSSKFDEINKRFEKLERENKILKSEIASLTKIVGLKMNSEQIFKEKLFVNHKKHIEFITQHFIPPEDLSLCIKNIVISREQLLLCIKHFENGICNILESIFDENFPIILMSFSRKNYVYLYDNNEWGKSTDKDITDFIKKIIIGPLFIEFTKWQSDTIKSNSQSTIDHSTYHNLLMLIMNTPQNMLSDFKKHMISKIRCIN